MTSPDNRPQSAYSETQPQAVGSWTLLGQLGKLGEKIIMTPLAHLLSWILGGSVQDWDTLGELANNIIPALIRLPIRILAQLLGLIPVVGDTIESTLTNYLAATANTASTAQSTATSAQATASSANTAAGNAVTTANSALAAATAANGRVDALITGGVRTLYTSSTTWSKPAGAVKIGVICIGAGGGGENAKRIGEGNRAFGGGYVYQEFPADALPSTVALTIPLGGAANMPGPGIASFGSFLSSPTNGAGYIRTSSGRFDVLNAPGHPGALAEETGPSSRGGPQGGAGAGNSQQPGAGENGYTTGLDIVGAGGGGGGDSVNPGSGIGGTASDGGAGGFPGGPGGVGGDPYTGTGKPGGIGGAALIGVIVW